MVSVDFREQLERQLSFIRSSCELYDDGKIEEAIRIAVSLRVLFHETTRQTPLLSHLDAASISLLSTNPPRPSPEPEPAGDVQTVQVSFEMAPITFSRDGVFVEPELEGARHREYLPFDVWWYQTIFVVPPDDVEVSRRSLALAAAEKDGGAHVDRDLSPDYQRVIDALQFKTTVVTAKVRHDGKVANFHYVALRQIGFEVLNSHELVALSKYEREHE